jgi:hypothetical protein
MSGVIIIKGTLVGNKYSLLKNAGENNIKLINRRGEQIGGPGH